MGHGLSRDQDDDGPSSDSEMIEETESDEDALGETDANLDEVEDGDKFNDDKEVADEDIESKEDETDIEDDLDKDEYDKEDFDKDDECMYRFSKKKMNILEDNDEEYDGDDYFDEDEQLSNTNVKYVPNDKRIGKKILTKYERVRALGERARQISLGAKPRINDVAHMDPKEVAKMELKMKVMPLYIDRTFPNGQIERWDINELKIVN